MDSLFERPISEQAAVVSPQPRRWSFASLSTFVLAVEVVSSAWLIMHLIGAMWTTVLIWSSLLIAAHVAANAWGTRVSARSRLDRLDAERPIVSSEIKFAPATRLRGNRPLGWTVLMGAGIGAMIGATAGLIVLWLAYHDTLGYDGLIVGGASTALLGGFVGFLWSTFLTIGLRAWGEASADVVDSSAG